MQPMNVIRAWQFAQLRESLKIIERILAMNPPEALTTYKDSGEGWTVLQVLCHLRDFEDVFLQRMKLMLAQDMPDLPFPQPDALAAENNYSVQDVHEVMAGWKKAREQMLAFCETVAEEDWERPGNHPTRGAFTLHDQLLLGVRHDSEHTEQITRILMEQKS